MPRLRILFGQEIQLNMNTNIIQSAIFSKFEHFNYLNYTKLPNTNTNNTKVKIHIIKQPRPTLRMVKIASSSVHFNTTENYEGCFYRTRVRSLGMLVSD